MMMMLYATHPLITLSRPAPLIRACSDIRRRNIFFAQQPTANQNPNFCVHSNIERNNRK